MFWIVSYDIPNDKRRGKVAKILEGYGRRAQYSVFECEISDEQREKLERALQREIDAEEDDIRFYPMNRADLKRVRLLGRAELYRARGWYMV
ncbi:CRISPR-associated endonuclease Cas2 [Anaerolineae bacterium CFX9]|jgi:CRISPR-associated protein Cas2|nr:CRISPR-associated endonuclease Cas2 [Anaerolineae bacterium CFX9]